MELSFSINREARPSFSDIGDKPFRLNFKTYNREKRQLEVTFKIKIKETKILFFILNEKNIEVKEIEKKISVEPGTKPQFIDLSLMLKKRPDKPENVEVILFVENTDIPTKSISITCY